MSSTITVQPTSPATSVTFNYPVGLIYRPAGKTMESIYVDFADGFSPRDLGERSDILLLRGREGHLTAQAAHTFLERLAALKGEKVEVNWDMDDRTYENYYVMDLPQLDYDTNRYPGFHVDWQMRLERST